ncbi:MAG: hypothetical protein E6G56_11775 [Actinobacteria bacterium]|nr:MAG: hypothetical protein E6G56_11775 [Actinomycetota bacterium]
MGPGRLRGGELIGSLGSIVAVALLFAVDWFSRPGDTNVTGWDALITLRWVVVGTAALALAAAVAAAWARTPALPVAAAVAAAIAGIATALLLAYRVLISTPGPNHDYGSKVGAYVGLGCVVGSTLGALWAVRDERPRRATQVEAEVRPAPPRSASGANRPPATGGSASEH